MVANAEAVLKRLEIPYRVVERCTGDLGFSAAKGSDIEVLGRAASARSASCSTTMHSAAEARRDPLPPRRPACATLNGSGLAVGRTVMAVIENTRKRWVRHHSAGASTLPERAHTAHPALNVNAGVGMRRGVDRRSDLAGRLREHRARSSDDAAQRRRECEEDADAQLQNAGQNDPSIRLLFFQACMGLRGWQSE